MTPGRLPEGRVDPPAKSPKGPPPSAQVEGVAIPKTGGTEINLNPFRSDNYAKDEAMPDSGTPDFHIPDIAESTAPGTPGALADSADLIVGSDNL